jgi:hypothetical protein
VRFDDEGADMKHQLKENLLQCLIRDECKMMDSAEESYILLYREFVRYFESIDIITPHHVAIGAAFTFSWMPTILDFRVKSSQELESAAEILNRARAGPVTRQEICCIQKILKNSLVGASKLLHFVNPATLAIWDSRVCSYCFGTSDVSNFDLFQLYQDACQDVTRQPAFAPALASINRKVGYVVTSIRAAELIMYTGGSRQPPSDIKGGG